MSDSKSKLGCGRSPHSFLSDHSPQQKKKGCCLSDPCGSSPGLLEGHSMMPFSQSTQQKMNIGYEKDSNATMDEPQEEQEREDC